MRRASDAHPVVVLTNLRDLAADDVIRRLDAEGVDVRRINADDCVTSPVPTWSLETGSDVIASAVWWRQFELPAEPVVFDSTPDELVLVRAQWRAWLSTLAAPETPWVNDLWAARRAEDKVTQLRTARSLGFRVPRTIVTNDRVAAERFGSEPETVVKTLASAYFELSGSGFVYTNPLTAALTADERSWHAQPLVVQQRIFGAPVRVVVVGRDWFGARCDTAALDWRTAGTEAAWRRWNVPQDLGDRCLRYIDALALRYAAFDFVDDGDDVWFLEANQAGEWVFVDRRLKLGIVNALVELLMDLAARGH